MMGKNLSYRLLQPELKDGAYKYSIQSGRKLFKKPCKRNGSWENVLVYIVSIVFTIFIANSFFQKFKKILRVPYHPRGYPQRNPIYESIDDTPEPNLCEIRYECKYCWNFRAKTWLITCHYG